MGRDPVTGPALASQPTLSRFENVVGPRDLYRLTQTLADVVIASHQARLAHTRVGRITIDLDPTEDPTHGQQELSFFNGHYNRWCYLPVVGTLTFNGKRTQHLVTAILRPGNAHATRGVIGVLRRLFAKLRVAFPHARLRVCLDGGFASPAVFRFLEEEGVEYLVAMASNAKLEKRIRRLLGKARMRSKATGASAQVFGETCYAAKSWQRKRRVIMKAEVVRLAGLDPRSSRALVDLILEAESRGKTVITATNDLHIVAEIATRVLVFGEDRWILASGTPEEILTDRSILLAANLVHRHRHAHGDFWHEHEHAHPGAAHPHGHHHLPPHDHGAD